MRSSSALKEVITIVVVEKATGSRPSAAARACSVVGSTTAPAASVGPSIPSVPMLPRHARMHHQSCARIVSGPRGRHDRQGEFLIAAALPVTLDVNRRFTRTQ